MVARSIADREVPGSDLTLLWPNVNFSEYKILTSEAPLDQGGKWYPEKAVSV